MLTLSAVTVLINSLTLSLALGFLLIILWQNARQELNQFFALFLFLVIVWNVGSLFIQASILLAELGVSVINIAISVTELGFAGSSITLYILTTVLIGTRTRRFRLLALLSLILVLGTRIFLIVTSPADFVTLDDAITYSLQPSLLFYLLFNSGTLYLLWRYRRKFRSRFIIAGIFLFIIGQSLTFFNPELIIASFSTSVSSIGALIISVAILQQEIITPLSERNSQVETMHQVSLAITSELSLDTILNEITSRAAGWVRADAAGIFLAKGDELELVNVYELPKDLLNTTIDFGDGIAGTVAQSKRTIHLENYARDWQHSDDLPLARETFGAVICVPLIYLNKIIGVLMVVSGHQGRLFNKDDVYSLELLSAQAAVAIAHGRVFAEQRALAEQLETVLTSTESPVIAVDRKFHLIFANSAARKLFSLENSDVNLAECLPESVFPDDYRTVLRTLRQSNSYIYEISLDGKIYQCHLAILGRPRIAGWVAILNDVTQLFELDRVKSEMVRMASHDLKNPLMGAMAYIDLLRDDIDASVDGDLHSVDMIETQLNRMHRIIKGVLDVERIKAGSELNDVCYPAILVENVLHDLDILIKEKDVKLETQIADTVPTFLGDREQFERALVNLVENAIKFTLEDSHICIAVYSQHDRVMFEVRDNGIGIPEELHNRVFDRFYRGKQFGVEHVTGSGLGLSLVKTIVENHKGKIWLESKPNQGTTFFISIPSINSYSQKEKQ